MIQAVSFDIGGTLIEFSNIHSFKRTLYQQCNIDPDMFQRAYRDHFIKHVVSQEEFINQTKCINKLQMEDLICDYYATKPLGRIAEGTPIVLHELKAAGLVLLTVSNKAYCNPSRLSDYGLDSFFDAEIYSCDVGFAKPEKGIFDFAAHHINIAPKNILHVGNSVRSDVHGALAAGWESLLIHKESLKRNCNMRCSCENLLEALNIIKKSL